MNRKPDVIRSLVIIFVVGLVVSGFTNLGASERSSQVQAPLSQSSNVEQTGWAPKESQ